MQKWEYKVLLREWASGKPIGKKDGWFWTDALKEKDARVATQNYTERLNALGQQGWECFSIETSLRPAAKYEPQLEVAFYRVVFKRPLEE